MRLLYLLLSWSAVVSVFGQSTNVPAVRVSYPDLEMVAYPGDTSASAVTLAEWGYMDARNVTEGRFMLEYQSKIKILKRKGLAKADFAITLYKSGNREERWMNFEASIYNLENGSIREKKVTSGILMFDKSSKYHNTVKFALPDVRVGTVIVVKYSIESPFLFTLRPWEFQDEFPKLRSELTTQIPGLYVYHTALRGFQKLKSQESEIETDCVTGAFGKADCVKNRYVMENIPAFDEEEYMTTKSNFLSAIYFELSEYYTTEGLVKVTKAWQDVEAELLLHDSFGKQLRKARGISDPALKKALGAESDPLAKARIIYDFVAHHFSWDGVNSKYSLTDAKKAYELGKGNVGDINLVLTGLLQANELEAYPVILSTRSNGTVTELFPVLTEFDYVVAQVAIDGKNYLLDATEPYLPFGILPVRCLNGKGRIIGKDVTGWIDLKPIEKRKKVITADLTLLPEGRLSGEVVMQEYGYASLELLEELGSGSDASTHLKKLKSSSNAEITNYTLDRPVDASKPLTQRMTMSLPIEGQEASIVYFNPFLFERLTENPFKLNQRLYPVDYGVALEVTVVLNLTLPQDMAVDEMPQNAALQLPLGGGKYLFNTSVMENKISITTSMSLNKPVFSAGEYKALKDFYERIIALEQSTVVLKKK
jgi:hypothetical protein